MHSVVAHLFILHTKDLVQIPWTEWHFALGKKNKKTKKTKATHLHRK